MNFFGAISPFALFCSSPPLKTLEGNKPVRISKQNVLMNLMKKLDKPQLDDKSSITTLPDYPGVFWSPGYRPNVPVSRISHQSPGQHEWMRIKYIFQTYLADFLHFFFWGGGEVNFWYLMHLGDLIGIALPWTTNFRVQKVKFAITRILSFFRSRNRKSTWSLKITEEISYNRH